MYVNNFEKIERSRRDERFLTYLIRIKIIEIS